MSNGPCSSPLVVPERHPLDRGRFDLLGRLQHEDVAEAFLAEAPERPPKLRLLLADDVRAEVPVGPQRGCAPGRPARAGQHDGDRQAVVLPGQLDQRLAGLGLDVGGVDDRQPAQGQPLGGDEVQHLEGVVGDRLVVLVVADHRPGRRPTTGSRWAGSACGRTCSCPSRWGRSGRRGTELGDRDLHGSIGSMLMASAPSDRCQRHPLETLAICVGGPSVSSSGPTGRNRTA